VEMVVFPVEIFENFKVIVYKCYCKIII